MSINSMSPVKSELFVPPSVKTPPGSSVDAEGFVFCLVSQKDISGEVSVLVDTSVCQKGGACVLAMASKARPMIPETLPSKRPPVSLSTAKNCWLATVKPPIETESEESFPATAPDPYRMVTSGAAAVLWKVDDLDAWKRGVTESQDVHDVSASHRSEEPVSRMTLNGCGGVPIVIDPK